MRATSLETYLGRLLPAVALIPALLVLALHLALPALSWLYLGLVMVAAAVGSFALGRELGRRLETQLNTRSAARSTESTPSGAHEERASQARDDRGEAEAQARGHQLATRVTEAAEAVRALARDSLYLQAQSLARGAEARELTQAADRMHRAATQLAGQLRCLRADDGDPGTEPTADPGAIAALAVDLLQPRLQRQGVSVAVTVAEDTPPCAGHALALQAVFVQVLENALDALASAPPDEATGDDDPRLAIDVAPAPGGSAVAVEIRDRGVGWPAGPRARLLQPGVSTKGPGRGTGLALARHRLTRIGAVIDLEPQTDGPGARVRLTIPVARTP